MHGCRCPDSWISTGPVGVSAAYMLGHKAFGNPKSCRKTWIFLGMNFLACPAPSLPALLSWDGSLLLVALWGLCRTEQAAGAFCSVPLCCDGTNGEQILKHSLLIYATQSQMFLNGGGEINNREVILNHIVPDFALGSCPLSRVSNWVVWVGRCLSCLLSVFLPQLLLEESTASLGMGCLCVTDLILEGGRWEKV